MYLITSFCKKQAVFFHTNSIKIDNHFRIRPQSLPKRGTIPQIITKFNNAIKCGRNSEGRKTVTP